MCMWSTWLSVCLWCVPAVSSERIKKGCYDRRRNRWSEGLGKWVGDSETQHPTQLQKLASMCFLSQYVSTSHLLYRVNSLKTHSLPPCKSAMGPGSTHVQYHAPSNLCINCLTFNHTALCSSLPQPSSAQITCKHSMQSTTAILQPLYTTTQPFSSQPLTRKHTALDTCKSSALPTHSSNKPYPLRY